jgi:3-phenylpropionate/trans-cinnamate dioxygenase ferredoxin reductase subunit
MPQRFVIVGNGIAGTTCAEALKAQEPDSQVALLGLEPYPLYNRVALPRFLKGGIPRERVIMRSIEQHQERGIDLLLERTATKVDNAAKIVLLDDGRELPYDALMVCTGGRPNAYPAPGADEVRELSYGFQTLDDTDILIEKMIHSQTAAVVGGSFIAYELAEGFRHRGLQVHWIQRGPRFLRRTLNEEGGQMVDFLAHEAGVETIYNQEVAKVAAQNGHVAITTTTGREISVDMLGYGLGLNMYDEWLEGSGVATDNGIIVDEYLETNVKGIFAGGDIAKFTDLMLDGLRNQMGTWDNAEDHGKTIALNMLGQRTPYKGIPTYTTSMFNSNLAVMGMTPDTGAELESVHRLDLPGRSYRALFFYKGRIAGAILVGSPKGRKKLIEMMDDQLQVPPGERERLLDPANLV